MVNFGDSVVESAVSLAYFKDFVSSLSNKPNITTAEVVQQLIRPACKGRYVDTISEQHVGPPTFFVCHRWANSFHHTAQSLIEYLVYADPLDTFLWIDIFAVDQHQSEATKKDVDNVMTVTAASAGGTLVVLDPDGLILGRSWCLFEIWATLQSKGAAMVHWVTMGFLRTDLTSAFLTADMGSGNASSAIDRTKLQERVAGVDGHGVREFTMRLRLMFILDPLDYGLAMQRTLLAWRMNNVLTGGKQNKSMEKYIDWIHLPPSHPNYKAFAIYGPSGTNKTTICQILCSATGREVEGLKPHCCHFVLQNDRSRVDPMCMMRTFAFQLAVSIPDIQPYIVNIDPAKVFKLTQVDQAFNMLVRSPLARLARDGKAPPLGVIILIDGLDEADWRGTYENPLLMVIREFFPTLPTFCRFIVTSRPEADCPHIVRSLRYKFMPMECTPRDLLHRDEVAQYLEVRLGACMESPGVVPETADRFMKNGRQSTVYGMAALAVMKQFQSVEGKHWGLDDLQRVPSELNACLNMLLKGAMLKMKSQKERSDLMLLIQVLAVAREPLTMIQIHTLGLRNYLTSLPGWNFLFLEQDYKVCIAHKSVSDWLTSLDPTHVAASLDSSVLGSGELSPTTSPAKAKGETAQLANVAEQAAEQVAELLAEAFKGLDIIPAFSLAAGHKALAASLMHDAIESLCPTRYSLRHVVAHLCQAGDAGEVEALVLEFTFWERLYAAGFGPEVFKDLLELAPTGSKITVDIIRWLRSVSETLVKQPKAALQLACDAPIMSSTSMHAKNYKRKPDAVMVNRDENWSPCLMILSDLAIGGRVTSVCFSPDGNKIANGSTSKTVRLWDANTGQQVALLEGPSSVFNSVCFSADGGKLASGSADKTVRVWDAKTGETLSVLEGHKDAVTAVAMSPDMSKLASASCDKSVRLWDMKIMEEICVFDGHRDTVNSVSFTLDGSKIASGSADRTVRMWDIKQAKQLTLMEGHFGVIYMVACSPYSSQLASCSADKSIRIWSPDAGTCTSVLEGHQAPVTGISYSGDGAFLASCSADKTIRVWNAKLFQQLLVIERMVGDFRSISFSQDGAQLASGSTDKTLRLWDAKTGEEVAVLDGHLEGINCVMLSPNGVRAASSSLDKTVRLWDIKSDRQVAVLKGHSGVFSSVTFSPDGELLASGSDDKTVRVWDAKTGQQVGVAEGHIEPVTDIAFSPCGTKIASSSEDKSVKLWDAFTGAQIPTPWPIVHETGIIKSVAYSPDGTKLATGSADMQKTVRIWDSSTGKQLAVAKGHFAPVTGVSFSPNSAWVASGSQDRTVRIWDSENGAQLSVLEGHTDAVTSISFCQTMLRIASVASDKTVRIWDHHHGWKCVAVLTGHVKDIGCVAIHPNGMRVVSSGSETVRLWSLPPHSSKLTARQSMRIRAGSGGDDDTEGSKGVEVDRHNAPITCITFAPDGSQVATASYDKTVRLWDSKTGKGFATLKGHSGVVNVVVFSPNSSKLASGGADENVRIWEARTGMLLHELCGHSNWVRTLSFSPTGTRLLSGSDDSTLRMWDPKTGAELSQLEGHTNWVRCVEWSMDGTKLLSGSEDKTTRLWDSKSGKVVGIFEGHNDLVTCVAFSPNGQIAATGSEDRTVRLWNTYNYKFMAELKGHYGIVLRVRFSPDGSKVGSSCADKVFRMWSTTTFSEIKAFQAAGDGLWVNGNLVTLNSESGVISVMDSVHLTPIATIFSTYRLADMACSPGAIACRVAGWESVSFFELNESNMHEKLTASAATTSAASLMRKSSSMSKHARKSRSPSPRRKATASPTKRRPSPRRAGMGASPTRR